MSGCPNRRTGKRHGQNTDRQNSRIEGHAEQAPYAVGGPVTAYPRQHKDATPSCPRSLEGNEGRLSQQAHGKAAAHIQQVGAHRLPTGPEGVGWRILCATPTRRDRRCSTRLVGHWPRDPPRRQIDGEHCHVLLRGSLAFPHGSVRTCASPTPSV
jgi:hypothetical protein